MSHAMGVVCPHCGKQTQPEVCPEGCGSHGSTYIGCADCALLDRHATTTGATP